MNKNIPKDPMILLSYVNLKLRDFYPSLDEMCKALDIDQNALVQTLASIDYAYDPDSNRFV
ncbi:MAG TPA: DUF4250 domain-containing protein [Candidatus Scybalocola faecigallinarum]|uniref:DUF4250 domain-containing protein n=1 Tax=Candidatus Scybalocola faecigallinarum TaxID=2840941 RepID=A0A9D1F3J1_9FIRM|nr:DUF4250 domain-containing protein [Candidatus Scybalocola faecigallinarum]